MCVFQGADRVVTICRAHLVSAHFKSSQTNEFLMKFIEKYSGGGSRKEGVRAEVGHS